LKIEDFRLKNTKDRLQIAESSKARRSSVRFADHLKGIPDYVPGKPVEELERELGIKEAIKMASNENFQGPSPRVSAAIAERIGQLNLYPDSGCFALRRALAKKFGIQPAQVIVGNGSNYVIELICRCVLNPGDEGMTCDPSFAFYRRAIRGALGTVKPIPLKNFECDLEEISRSVSEKTRVIFLASPNNPTGRLIPFSQLKSFMNRLDPGIFVALDEAYFEFVESPEAVSGLQILKDHENLIVLRTYSKIFSLAGLRIGFGIAHPTVIQALLKLFLPFSVSTLSQAAALASLEEEKALADIKRINQEGKLYFYRELDNLGLSFVPTEANFILVNVGEASRVDKQLQTAGIIVRDMTPWNLPRHIRVTISTPENNRRLIEALRSVLGR
jgi:histidinol-phosphate aminotransferase